VVRGSVPGGGCTANLPPVVPGTNAPGLLDFDGVIAEWPCDFLFNLSQLGNSLFQFAASHC
jgi:hypothetical protein